MQDKREPIETAGIRWREDGSPESIRFGDIYFSTEDGVAESEYVFLRQNRMEERFRGMAEPSFLAIGELGFGTGLNFFLTWKLFRETAPAGARLHFFSCEKYPVSPADLRRLRPLFRLPDDLLDEFESVYGAFLPGFQTMALEEGRVLLHLYLGDVEEFLSSIKGEMDVWYLDGFAPAKNDAMWGVTLFQKMALLSRLGTTLATFSAAGRVKRGLEEAGFRMEKVAGFGRKKEMLRGTFASVDDHSVRRHHVVKRIAVIGGGIAGTAVAGSLAARGIRVDLFEQEPQIATKASGNLAGIVHLFLNAHPTAMSRFLAQAFLYIKSHIRILESRGEDLRRQACGVLHISHDDRQRKRFQAALQNLGYPESLLRGVAPGKGEDTSGVFVRGEGVLYPDGFYLHPPALCRANVKRHGERIQVRTSTRVVHLRPIRMDSLSWELQGIDETSLGIYDAVVIATGYEALEFPGMEWLPVRKNRGQVALIPANEKSRCLKSVVCYGGYIIPSVEGTHVVGATYDREKMDLELDPERNRAMLRELDEWIPGLFDPDAACDAGRVGFRTTALDHMPLIGPLPDRASLERSLAEGPYPYSEIPVIPGLYLSVGHASRGMLYAHLGAELIAAQITGEPWPVERELGEALHPDRFLKRLLKDPHRKV